jgi:hypothetical protein
MTVRYHFLRPWLSCRLPTPACTPVVVLHRMRGRAVSVGTQTQNRTAVQVLLGQHLGRVGLPARSAGRRAVIREPSCRWNPDPRPIGQAARLYVYAFPARLARTRASAAYCASWARERQGLDPGRPLRESWLLAQVRAGRPGTEVRMSSPSAAKHTTAASMASDWPLQARSMPARREGLVRSFTNRFRGTCSRATCAWPSRIQPQYAASTRRFPARLDLVGLSRSPTRLSAYGTAPWVVDVSGASIDPSVSA